MNTYQYPFMPCTPQGEYNRKKERELMDEDQVMEERRKEHEARLREQAEDARRDDVEVAE